MKDEARHRAVVPPAFLDAVGDDADLPLPPPALHRFRRVLRLKDGATVEVFDGGGRSATGTLRGDGLASVQLRVVPPDAFAPRVLQAWVRPKKMEDAVRRATEMGAAGFALVVCARSQSHPKGSQGEKVRDRLARIAGEAARQCGRTDVPDITGPHALLDALAAAKPAGAQLVKLDTALHPPLSGVLRGLPQGVAPWFVVGPEGGFDDAERVHMERAGARSASLGPTVLRTETAALAAVAIYAAVCGRA